MNPDLPNNERDELEAKLTALLLGELPADEAAALRAAMAQDPQLAALHDRLKQTIELVRESAAEPAGQTAPQPAPLKLSAERREQLLARFKTVTPEEFAEPRLKLRILVPAGIAAVLLGMLGATMFFSTQHFRKGDTSFLEGRESLSSRTWASDSSDRTPMTTTPAPADGKEKAVQRYTLGPRSRTEVVLPPSLHTDNGLSLASDSAVRSEPMFSAGDSVNFNNRFDQTAPSYSFNAPREGDLLNEGTVTTLSGAEQHAIDNTPPAGAVDRKIPVVGDMPFLGSVFKSEEANQSGAKSGVVVNSADVSGGSMSWGALEAGVKTYGDTNGNPNSGTVAMNGGKSYSGALVLDDVRTAWSEPAKAVPAPAPAPARTLRVPARPEPVDPITGLPIAPPPLQSPPEMPDTMASIPTGGEPVLETRKFSVDPKTFQQGLASVGPLAYGEDVGGRVGPGGSGGGGAGGLRFVTATNSIDELQDGVRLFYRAAGVDLKPEAGKSVFFNDGDGTIIVRATKEELDVIEAANQALAIAPPEVNVRAKFAEVGTNDNRALGFATGIRGYGGTTTEQGEAMRKQQPESRADLPQVGIMTAQTLRSVETMRIEAEAQHAKQEKLLSELKNLSRDDLKKALPTAIKDNELDRLLGELEVARRNGATGDVDAINQKVDDRVNGVVLGLQAQVDSLGKYTKSLKAQIETAGQTDIGRAEKAAPYLDAKQKLEEQKRFAQLLNTKILSETATGSSPKSGLVEVVDRATPPAKSDPTVGERLKSVFTGKIEKTATARVRVQRDHSDIAAANQNQSGAGYDPYFIQTEFEVVQSDLVLTNVVSSLNLQEAWAKKNGSKLKMNEAVELLRDRLDLRPVRNTELIEIKTKSEDPQEAARLANAVAESYRQYRLNQAREVTLRGIKTLNEQFAEQEKKIAATEAEVKRLEDELSIKPQTEQPDAPLPKPQAGAPIPQPEMLVRENAFSTFSLNVSDVSFKLAAASLEKGILPEPASIRSEEFINAFDYRDPEPTPGSPIAFAADRARYPFAHNRDLLRFSLKTAAAGRQPGTPLNLVLLLDNSGSMERADRVRIVREALRVLARQLQPQDKLSIITFARTPRLWVDGASGTNAAAAVEEVGRITPEGGTNLGDALDLAYATALSHYLAGGVNRVVLLTDGAANLGNVDPDALKQKVEAHRKQGVALDCFGIGWEGFNDDLLEILSRNGDGRYGFINTPEEAAGGFASQLAGALNVAASDVKVQVEFNSNRVTAYRQIGYAKHQLTKEQFRDNTVDAAEIAAAESGNALYVVDVNAAGNGPLATVRVRYKVPGTGDYHEQEWAVPYSGSAVPLEQAAPAMRLAATASAFSEWLAASPYAGEVSPNRLLGYVSGVPGVYGADSRPKRLEWMIRQAGSIGAK